MHPSLLSQPDSEQPSTKQTASISRELAASREDVHDSGAQTLPTRADEAGGTGVKFYELRDNLDLLNTRALLRLS